MGTQRQRTHAEGAPSRQLLAELGRANAAAVAALLEGRDRTRYLALSARRRLTRAEREELAALLRTAEARGQEEVQQTIALSALLRAGASGATESADRRAQREVLFALVQACYPSAWRIWLERRMGVAPPAGAELPPARAALERVRFLMESTHAWGVLADPAARVRLLEELQRALGPLLARITDATRKRDARATRDLDAAYGVRAAGKGRRSVERVEATRAEWHARCWALHALRLAGVPLAAALARVAHAEGCTEDALKKAYRRWRTDASINAILARGDAHATRLLRTPEGRALIDAAYPSGTR